MDFWRRIAYTCDHTITKATSKQAFTEGNPEREMIEDFSYEWAARMLCQWGVEPEMDEDIAVRALQKKKSLVKEEQGRLRRDRCANAAESRSSKSLLNRFSLKKSSSTKAAGNPEKIIEILRKEKGKAEMELSNAQSRNDRLEEHIVGLLLSGKDTQLQLESEREQNVSLQRELGNSRCEIEQLREAGIELQRRFTSDFQQHSQDSNLLKSELERAHANTATIEQEKKKMVDRCFEAEEQLAEATALQSEMQKQLLLGQQRESEMIEERKARELEVQQLQVQNTSLAEQQADMQKQLLAGQQREGELMEEKTARELEVQQLQVQNTSLAENQVKLEKEVVLFKLQAERIMDNQFMDNMPPQLCDVNVPLVGVEDELTDVGRIEKNPKRKRKY